MIFYPRKRRNRKAAWSIQAALAVLSSSHYWLVG
jgi:hypothetical protein